MSKQGSVGPAELKNVLVKLSVQDIRAMKRHDEAFLPLLVHYNQTWHVLLARAQTQSGFCCA